MTREDRKNQLDRAWVEQLVTQAQKRKFRGNLILNFHAGDLKRCKKEETLLPPSTKNSPSSHTLTRFDGNGNVIERLDYDES